MRNRTDKQLETKIAALGDLTRDELVDRWAAAYGCPPPSGMRNPTLLYAAAWHLQAKQLGGFSSETRRLLKRAVQGVERRMIRQPDAGGVSADASAGTTGRRVLAPGARLLRDWNGRTHVVDVTERGFLFNSKTYRSLSAIAREITGAQWSGPRFFGL